MDMTLRNICELQIINDDTHIWVHDFHSNLLTDGNWYQDNILRYMGWQLKSFIWQDDNNFFVYLKWN